MESTKRKEELLKRIKKYNKDYWDESEVSFDKLSDLEIEDIELVKKHAEQLADDIIELFDK